LASIVVDVGNSSTAIGRYAAGRVTRVTHVAGGIVRAPDACADAVRRAATGGVDAAMLGSVVPAVNASWRRLLRRVAGAEAAVLDHRFDLPVKLDYPNPETTGADRIANVVGAVIRYGAPVLVVDIGTAVTYDLVSADRRFFAGVIGPGPQMLADALHEKTALLPRIELRGPCPRKSRDTVSAMRIGVEVGYRGLLRETVAWLRPLLGRRAVLCATGGCARRYIPPLGLAFRIDPTLTLFGLGWILDYREKQR
jgi:type III pantothenate kinase